MWVLQEIDYAEVRWLSLGAATVVSMVVGALWYSGALFGKQWMRHTGKTMDQMDKKKAMGGYLVAIVGAFVLNFILLHVLTYAEAGTWQDGLQGGALVWLGFIAIPTGVAYVFEGRPVGLFFITVGHHLVELLINGAILASMGLPL